MCRTGSCGIWWVATGSTSAAEVSTADDDARQLRTATPFPRAGTVGRGPLRCTPFAGQFGKHPISKPECKEGKQGRLLQPPTWDAYRAMLGAAAEPCAATATAATSTAAAAATGACAPTLELPGGAAAPLVVDYAQFEAALERVAAAAVAYLPSRLLVREETIPPKVREQLRGYCKQTFAWKEVAVTPAVVTPAVAKPAAQMPAATATMAAATTAAALAPRPRKRRRRGGKVLPWRERQAAEAAKLLRERDQPVRAVVG